MATGQGEAVAGVGTWTAPAQQAETELGSRWIQLLGATSEHLSPGVGRVEIRWESRKTLLSSSQQERDKSEEPKEMGNSLLSRASRKQVPYGGGKILLWV